MKKILTIALSLILALSAFAMFGCGGDATFDGNYTEMSATELTAYKAEVAEKEIKYEEDKIVAGKGFEINVDAKMKTDFEEDGMAVLSDASVKANYKMAYADKLVMGGNYEVKSDASTKGEYPVVGAIDVKANVDVKADFAFDGEAVYVSAKAKGSISGVPEALESMIGENISVDKEYKVKQEVDFYEVEREITGFVSSYTADIDLNMMLEMYTAEGVEDVKILIDKSDVNNVKVKFEMSGMPFADNDDPEAKELEFKEAYVIIVYDSETNVFKACKQVMNLQLSEEMSIDMTFSIKPYDGTVEMPADAADYKEGEAFDYGVNF